MVECISLVCEARLSFVCEAELCQVETTNLSAEDEEEVTLSTVDPNSFGKSGAGGSAYDSDEEQPGHGQQQGVQCAQQ